MIARILAEQGLAVVHNRAGANMKGGVATALLEQRGDDRPVRSGRGVAARGRRRAVPAHRAARPTSSATSSTATASWRCWRTTGATLVAARAGDTAFVLNADDPLVADLGRDAEGDTRQRRHVLRPRGPRARAGAHRARIRREALPPLRHRVPLLGRLPRPPRRLPLPQLRQCAPAAAGVGARRRAARHVGLALHARLPAGRGARRAAPARPLQRLQRARRRPPAACSSASSLEEIRRGLESFAAAFGRAEQIAVGGRQVAILLVKNPAGANEVFRTLAAADGAGPRRVDGPQRPDRRRPRRVLDLGRRLRDARARTRRASCAPAPAPRSWRCASSMRASRRSQLEVVPRAGARPRPRAPDRTAAGRSTHCPPTPRCSSCATC